uniref:Uncharacterized protein n=1 Tax=Arundo donax TaxID=35708 RepID=A0A0A9D2P0_ARUDO
MNFCQHLDPHLLKSRSQEQCRHQAPERSPFRSSPTMVCATPPGPPPCSPPEGSAAPSPLLSAESTTGSRGATPPWTQAQSPRQTCPWSPPPCSGGKCPTTANRPPRSCCTCRKPSACPPSPRASSAWPPPTSWPGPSRRSGSPSHPRSPSHSPPPLCRMRWVTRESATAAARPA